ncbi:MAG: isochorismatase family protein [Smithellaceae bacterium]|nr:isochorismatase family protein [Smithellaceae bacterium]
MSSYRDRYFTAETIEKKTGDFLGEISHLTRGRGVTWGRERIALLVLDMQQFFFSPLSHAFIPSARAIVPGVKELIRAFRGKGLPVIFTRHINSPQNSGSMGRWWGDIIQPRSPLADLIGELDPKDGLLMEKSQYDAFYQTDIEEVLRKFWARETSEGNVAEAPIQLVICGVMTHLCCETTARSAFVRGFEVLFVVDGTATYNEDFHRASLLNLSHGFAFSVTVKEILANLPCR